LDVKTSTSNLCLDMREVEVVAVASKPPKTPPPARVWMRGRWRRRQLRRNHPKLHLRLAFEWKGGGGDGTGVENVENATPGSHSNVREVVVVRYPPCSFRWGLVWFIRSALMEGRRRETSHNFVVARFRDAPHGPPNSWVPPGIPPSYNTSRQNKTAHIPLERGGACAFLEVS